MKRIFSAVVAVLLTAAGAAHADMQGVPAVVDGDTLRLDGRLVHLYGVDAPETAQMCQNRRGRDFDCGAIAQRTLDEIVGHSSVSCHEKYRDSRGDTVAVCMHGRADIGEQIILQGWALADPDTGAGYRRAQSAAQGMREGLWRLKFIPPWEWRAANH